MKFLAKLRRNEEGATAIEYGLIAALIAVAAIAAMQGMGSQLSATFNKSSEKMAEGVKSADGTTTTPPATNP